MKQSVRLLAVISFALLAFAVRSPAPLIYQPGEGWVYETPGSENGSWQRARAKDQLEVARAAYDNKDFPTALKAAYRVEKTWPLSDYAPRAQYLIGLCYEATGNDERAFNAYQRIIDNNPKADNYEEVLGRQYAIANRYLAGQWFKLWNFIPFFPSMDKTAGMYEKIIKSGPYSDVAAQSQLKIGEAREKQDDPSEAIKAYQLAADRYNDRPKIAADALYKSGMAYRSQFRSADYDKNLPAQSIAALTDFITLYPGDPRVPEAQKTISELKLAAAQGSFSIAKYYEEKMKWNGALIYYNDVLVQDPNSPLVPAARQKIDALKRMITDAPAPLASAAAPVAAAAPAAAASTPAPSAAPDTATKPGPATETSQTAIPVASPAQASPAAPGQKARPAETVSKTKSGWWNPLNWLPSAPHPRSKSAAPVAPADAAGNSEKPDK